MLLFEDFLKEKMNMLILMAISSMKLFRIQWLRMRKKQCKEVIHNKVVIMIFTRNGIVRSCWKLRMYVPK